ncbi:hypothetical protein Undi14_09810 [Undibacterium sp. 14-3-2]|uniref:hypothetical protein n=1 Tax=Undibacterium sp. 14-3-2 TaxID=2800129 RepID=UPI001905B1EA|nr:hypothetical protein [Undibacterium sp. 14-3-2]MBK1890337.1 hypothetical protein [Undibacterium sp. 14-3-2]
MAFKCSAWNNGKHHKTGAGYGLKLSIEGRDKYFKTDWKSVQFMLPVEGGFKIVALNIEKPSFWNKTCHEVINKEIGEWLLASSLAPWPRGVPPKFTVIPAGERMFMVSKINT